MTDGRFGVHLQHFSGDVKEGFGVSTIVFDLKHVHGVSYTKLLGHREVKSEIGAAKIRNTWSTKGGQRKREINGNYRCRSLCLLGPRKIITIVKKSPKSNYLD